MSNVVPINDSGSEITQYDPTQTAPRVAFIDAGRKYAQRIRNWDEMDAAIDALIAEQRKFVAWWTATVTTRQSAGRGVNELSIADQQSTISVEVATRETHITAAQVCRWRKALDDEDDYRAKLRAPSYKRAMAQAKKKQETDESSVAEDETLSASEADEAIHQTARYLKGSFLNPPKGVRISLKDAMARASTADIKIIKAAAAFLAELKDAAK
jgi:hypothetical protein